MVPTMTMMSSVFLHVSRRPLPLAPAARSCSRCNNQISQRYLSSRGKQRRARADKLREAALAKKGGSATNKGKKPSSTSDATGAAKPLDIVKQQAQGVGKAPSRQSAPPPPPAKRNLPVAPHMTSAAVRGKNKGKGGWSDHVVENPILYAGVIFPTITMGVLLLVKPNLREQLPFGGFGGGGGKKTGNASMNASKETPVYDSVNAVQKEEKKEIVQTIVSEETVTPAKIDAVATSVSEGSPDEKDVNNEIATKKEGTAVVDLFYAFGIRPHSS